MPSANETTKPRFEDLDPDSQRMTAQAMQDAMAASMFGGSALSKEMQDAFRSIDYQDADGDIDNLNAYQSVAYQLSRTNEIAISALNKLESSIIGTGLRLQPDFNREALLRMDPTLTEQRFDDLEGEIEDDFVIWAEDPRNCDVEQNFTFYDHQRLALRTEKAAGDSFALIGRRNPRTVQRGGYLTMLQSIAPQRITNKDNEAPTRQRSGGIVRNTTGAVVGYDVQLHHPDTVKFDIRPDEWTYVPRYARSGRQNMIHMMHATEVDQSRGQPILAPIAKTIARISKFSDAQVMAALVQAFFAVYFEQQGGPSNLSYGEKAELAGNTPMNADGSVDLKEGTGIVGGSKPHMIATSHPGPHIEQFFDVMLTNVGMALEIPREVLTNVFSTSYTSARAATLEFWKTISIGRHAYSLKYCKPIYAAFLRDRVSQGEFDLPLFNTNLRAMNAWCGSVWLGDARGAIDKGREVNPELEMIKAGVRAPSAFSEEYNGQSYKKTQRRAAKDKRSVDGEGIQPAQNEPKLQEVADRMADAEAERNAANQPKPDAGVSAAPAKSKPNEKPNG